MTEIIQFFNHPFFIIVGGITTLSMFIGLLYVIFLVIKGIIPVWYRLGLGLSKRRIAIFAQKEFSSLNDLFLDSKIFANTIQIHKNNIKKAEKETLFVVHYSEFKNEMDDILKLTKDSTPLIIYAPQEEGFIDKDILKKINKNRNAVIVNFRGRLLNDVVTSLITTSYDK